MNLADGDRAEHLPYVQAGFAVLAYELDGALQDRRNNNDDFIPGGEAFLAARPAWSTPATRSTSWRAGCPRSTPNESLPAVGHSSAGTMVLLLTENEAKDQGVRRVRPVVDTAKRTPPPPRPV